MLTKKNEDGQIKLTKLSKMVAAVSAGIFTVVGGLWAVFIYLDTTYVSAKEVSFMEERIENNTVDTFEKQQRILDIRYLEQLQCQKALMEKELERDPDDRLIEDKLERIERTIERVENQIYTQ